jgi:leader peptidase (prepilin peptidase)/N-methyltransferase
MQQLGVFLVAVAGVLGLLIGSFLNVVAYRVPARISLLRESRCPHCEVPVKPWQNVPVVSWMVLRGQCANCHAAISPRYPIVEAITGIAFALVTGWVLIGASSLANGAESPMSVVGWCGVGLVILALLYFASISIVLTLIDLDTNRLPNVIVLPSYLVAGVMLAVASWLLADWEALLRAAIGMVTLYAFYSLLRLVRPGGMGGGDVKLAGVIGIYLGWFGWGALSVGAFAAFLFGGVFGIALIMLRRAGRKTAIPFGPWMILGAWTGLFIGEPLGRWYVNVFVGS